MKLMAGLRPSVRSSGSADITSAILSVIFSILHGDENRTNMMTDYKNIKKHKYVLPLFTVGLLP